MLNTHLTITTANRHRSTCFTWSGKPKALGGHTSSSSAKGASRFLVSKWWAGKSAERLGSTVSKKVRGIWKDEEHVWGRSEGEKCPYLLLRTDKEGTSLGVWGEGNDREVEDPRSLSGSETETFFDLHASWRQVFNHSGAQAQDFLARFYRHRTTGPQQVPVKRLFCRKVPACPQVSQVCPTQGQPRSRTQDHLLLKNRAGFHGSPRMKTNFKFCQTGENKERIQTECGGFQRSAFTV